MKTKFVSLIMSVAVIAGLMLVPAALPVGPVGVVLASNNVTISVQPALTQVGCGAPFALTVVVDNPDQVPISIVAARLDFDTTCIAVTGIVAGDFPITVLTQYDNVNGTIDFDGGMPMGQNTTSSSILVCTINCLSAPPACSGISAIDFVYLGGPPPRQTAAQFGPTDYLESGNMGLMTGATVKCGAPELTVDVSPAGKGNVEINSVAPGGYPDVSSWAWDEVVNLAAVAAAGWEWDSWTGTDNDGVNPTTVTMDVDESVVAVFTELPCDLDVDPNTISLEARSGVDEDSDTVTISNIGGHTLCWAVGATPCWAISDSWTYDNIYQPWNPNPMIPGGNASVLTQTVTGGGSGSDYQCSITIVPPAQRAIEGGIPAVLWGATAVVDECHLDWVNQIAMMTIFVPTPTNVTGTMVWDYVSACHGWPYYAGKYWRYNLAVDVETYPIVTPVIHKVVNCSAMVTGYQNTGPAILGSPPLGEMCWEVTHWTWPTGPELPLGHPNATVFMQTMMSPTTKNIVLQWDAGTFDSPLVGGALDIRSMTAYSSAPPPAGPPAWLSFDKTYGELGLMASEVLTVTGNTTGLAVGTHNGSFIISGCCDCGTMGTFMQETVDVSLNVLPATSIDVVRILPGDAMDYDAEYPGDQFMVTITFHAPVDQFNSIGLTDYAPAGWDVETDVLWCNPNASWTKSPYNKAEYAWAGPFPECTNFTAQYKVTIPATAVPGSSFWPNCTPYSCPPCEGSPQNMFPVWLEYWFDADGPFESCITGEREKIVTVPGCETGETRDVNGDVLDTVLVTLYEDEVPLNSDAGDTWEDNDSSSLVVVGNYTIAMYEDCADDTGMYYKIASRYCYYSVNTRPEADGGSIPPINNPAYPDYIDWSTPALLAAGNVLDFVGDYGLVCKAASMSYAMESVNHWLFTPLGDDGVTPEPDWRLSNWKAMESVHSWQFPCGCGCG